MLSCLAAIGLLAASASAATFRNPVSHDNTPDPGVLQMSNGTWVVTTTGGDSCGEFPIHLSEDLVHYRRAGCILRKGNYPSWATGSKYWAPEIHRVNGHHVAYFAAQSEAFNGVLSIGAATAKEALGPYTPVPQPLVVDQSGFMGAIDPNVFVDNGTPYLLWKQDGNAHGDPTPIMLAEMNDDGTKVVGKAVELIRNTLSWEGPLVEAPWLMRHDGRYWLFYSGNIMERYAVGVAVSDSLAGPYNKRPNAILAAGDSATHHLTGPGHCAVRQVDDGHHFMMWYHTWEHSPPVNFSMPRFLTQDTLTWGTWPQVGCSDGGSDTRVPCEGDEPVPA